MVFSDYTKRRIIHHHSQGLGVSDISRALCKEGIVASKPGISKFLKPYSERGTIERKSGSERRSKMTESVKKAIDGEMENDDERTGVELAKYLEERGEPISVSTALRCRKALGWTSWGSAYCQLIREGNKGKRLEWALQYQSEVEDGGYSDVIFTDECSVQLERHRRRTCRRVGQPLRPKPR